VEERCAEVGSVGLRNFGRMLAQALMPRIHAGQTHVTGTFTLDVYLAVQYEYSLGNFDIAIEK
jgi:hypothetical protein